jgi:hypothetical protein
MIRVRYCHPRDLSPGLNARVACHGRGTTIYLVPGLTADERRAVLRRLRQTARMGSGPELPAAQLVRALLADRIRTAAGRASAIFRLHPAGSALPVLLLSAGVIVFLALSAVSSRVLPQQDAGPSPVFAPRPAVTAGANPAQRSRHGEHQVNLDRAGPADGPGGSAGQPGSDSGQGTGGQGTGGGNGTTLTGSASSAPAPGGASTSPAPAGTPTPTPTPSPSPGPAEPGGTCLHVGPIGVCLDL